MKKYELLKYAYDKYPKGTEYKNLALGAKETSSGSFKINDDGVIDEKTSTFIFGVNENYPWSGKWAEIIDQPKSILDGKVAIQVSNEREFELLMKHYEEKGWKTYCDRLPSQTIYTEFVRYEDMFGTSTTEKYYTDKGYTIIPFSEFAKEVGIESTVFIMKSEDGVELFEGDEFFEVNQRSFSQEWYLVSSIHKVGKTAEKWELGEKDGYVSKAFSTKKAALDWIAEHNKPKQIKVKLFNKSLCAVVNEKNISIQYCEGVGNPIEISHSDIEDILHAIQQLKGGDNA